MQVTCWIVQNIFMFQHSCDENRFLLKPVKANVIHTKVKNGSCEPEFNQSFDLSLTRTDSVTIQILDKNKVHKKPRKAYLGTVTLTSQSIKRLKDKGIHRHNLTNKDHPDVEVKGTGF